jgi:transcriptional regulator with XRE-family HTH domain
MTTLGKRLRYAREAKGWSQTEVFRRTGINNKTLSRYEAGGTEPDVSSLKQLADLYEVSLDWLHGRETKESEYSLPESEMDRVIREAEEHYGVNLRDDPDVNSALRELIHSLAKLKSK